MHNKLRATTLASIMIAMPMAQAEEFAINARQITQFEIGRDTTQFGPLEFVGGLEMTSKQQHFGAISGIAFNEGSRTNFTAVADLGLWLQGTIERDEMGKPVTLSNLQFATISFSSSQTDVDKWQSDAESIAENNGKIVVSFEGKHRLDTFQRHDLGQMPTWQSSQLPPVDIEELRFNRGFESIAFAPESSAIAHALVGVSEKSLDENGNLMSFAILPDGTHFEFSLSRTDDFDPTDMAFLPDGDLIVLERRFTIQSGVAMRLRQIEDGAIKEGATIDGRTLLEADMRYQIDNMEALDITIDPDGTPRLTILSDDNKALLQRNLLLEFRYTGSVKP